MPQVQPIKLNKDERLDVPQPKHAPFLKLPRNECMLTVSGGGKTVAHIRTLMDADKLGNMFDKYIVMSPNVGPGGDPQYNALAHYIERTTGQKREECFFDKWDPQIILDIMEDMRKANAYVRKNRKKLGATRLYSCHITIDDYADQAHISKSNNSPLIQLFTKGRHAQCSCTCLVQKWRLLNSAIRVNCHSLWIGRTVSTMEVKALREEYGDAAGSEDAFEQMLRRATAPDFGFLYIVFGLKVRFFNGYGSEFVVRRGQAAEDDFEEEGNGTARREVAQAPPRRGALEGNAS